MNMIVVETNTQMIKNKTKLLLPFPLKFLPRGGGGTPRKIGWGCAACFPKPLPYLWPKSAIFPSLL